ncbi:hypothetical protein OH77DRAFT_1422033 [Trametes cingulata]|nr:hypothetical protein OH77DRAFT_1422033 [Trametes cingulata]
MPAALSGLRFPVPLPRDLDPTVKLPITVKGAPGLRIVSCAWINKHMPNQDIMRDVDDAGRCIDDLVEVKARKLYVQRAYVSHSTEYTSSMHARTHRNQFVGQRGADVSTQHPPESGFTVGHLLTLIIRKQLDGWIKSYKRMVGLVTDVQSSRVPSH